MAASCRDHVVPDANAATLGGPRRPTGHQSESRASPLDARGTRSEGMYRFGSRTEDSAWCRTRNIDLLASSAEDRRMAAIEHSVEIARSPEDVFAYIDDLERHGEWQPDIVSSTRETDGP